MMLSSTNNDLYEIYRINIPRKSLNNSKKSCLFRYRQYFGKFDVIITIVWIADD